MAKSQQRISKGCYQYLQTENFVEVKNYIFIQDGKRKGLLIRFLNDLGVTVDSMEYVITQFDVDGNIIDKTEIKHSYMKLRHGNMFVTEKAIVVDERCCDFKVTFINVRSGNYVYTLREGLVAVDLVTPQKALISKKKSVFKKSVGHFSVKRRVITRPTVCTLSPIVALILTLICLVMYMSFGYAKKYNGMSEEAKAIPRGEGYVTVCSSEHGA